jgi:hypothetical protein
MELILLYTGASARVVSCEYVVQQYCTKPLSGFSTGFIVEVCLSKNNRYLQERSSDKNVGNLQAKQRLVRTTHKAPVEKILSLRHQQKLGYSNQNEKTMRI